MSTTTAIISAAHAEAVSRLRTAESMALAIPTCADLRSILRNVDDEIDAELIFETCRVLCLPLADAPAESTDITRKLTPL
jgi:hypothetical protein